MSDAQSDTPKKKQGITTITRRAVHVDREIETVKDDTLEWYTRAKRLGQYLVFYSETPLTIGIQGDWGSGKSSFINLLEVSYSKRGRTDRERMTPVQPDEPGEKPLTDKQYKEYPFAKQLHCYLVHREEPPLKGEASRAFVYMLRFNSWVFAQSKYTPDVLFPMYVARVLEDYIAACGHSTTKSMTQNLASVVSGAAQFGTVVTTNLFAGDAAADMVREQLAAVTNPNQAVEKLAGFKEDFQEQINTLLSLRGEREHNRLIIVVDDLDRITALSAVELTEKLKVMLDVKGVIFMLAADLSIIQQGLQQKFGQAAAAMHGKNYLDKIVKIQYNVPQIGSERIAVFMYQYPIFRNTFRLPSVQPPTSTMQPALGMMQAFSSIRGNIRNIKRVMNNYEFSAYLNENQAHVSVPLLAITILYQFDFAAARRLYDWLGDDEQRGNERGAYTPKAAELVEAIAGDEPQHLIDQYSSFFGSMESAGQMPTVALWREAFTATAVAGPTASGGNEASSTEPTEGGRTTKMWLPEMIARGLVKVGDVVYIPEFPHETATIVNGRYVTYKGRQMPINEWGTTVTRWVEFNIYEQVYLQRTEQTLGELRGD